MTKVLKCGCKHAYQDKRYGPGKRLHNALAGGKGYRCTVCKKEQGK